MRSTATDLLDAHADLLPIRFTLEKHSFNATLQLLSLPPDHPLHPHIHRASRPIKRINHNDAYLSTCAVKYLHIFFITPQVT